MTDFTDLRLAAPLMKALSDEGYTTPTPIQAEAIPLVLEGRDLLGIAQTGTGKTAAFALPILDGLIARPGRAPGKAARVLVLAPTRELASQIADSFSVYGQFTGVRVQTVFGGVPIRRQMRKLERGCDVLVATPGRLLDLINQRALTLAHVETLVLDEADQMLDLGFIHDLRKIAALVPDARQTLFFSATMPKAIAELAGQYLTDPAKVSVAPQATTAERVRQQAMFVRQGAKAALLAHVLRSADVERAIVFTRTKHGADRVVRQLAKDHVDAQAIHGNKSQGQRKRALDAFKSGRCRVLVATDIAARGIDIDDVGHVINFEVPNVPEQYVHRIGRTARAGREGVAISFVAEDERPYLRDIQKLTRQDVPALDLPDAFAGDAISPEWSPADGAPSKSRRRRGQSGRRPAGPGKPHGRGGEAQAKTGGKAAGRGGPGKPARARRRQRRSGMGRQPSA